MRASMQMLSAAALLAGCSDASSVLTRAGGLANIADVTPPTVTVSSPNGGEKFTAGTKIQITWTSNDNAGVASHDIALSQDRGATCPITVATGVAGTVQALAWIIPAPIGTTTARICITAIDAAGNRTTDISDADFTIDRAPTADTQAPIVSISAPASGATLLANDLVTIQFSSTDNVAVTSHDVLFAADGLNFTTTLATGLSGTTSSFVFRVPSVATTSAAIRVIAHDAAGNRGSATVGSLSIITDNAAPTVTVTSPQSKDKVDGGSPLTVEWSSADAVGIVSHEIAWSSDGGATFTVIATGIPGNVQSFQVTAPGEKDHDAVVRVTARDAAGNSGSGLSAPFMVKKAKK